MNEAGDPMNWLAMLALLSWPLVAAVLFSTKPLSKAILWTLLGAQLLLPAGAGIKFEMIPQLDKSSIPNLCVLVACFLVARAPLRILAGAGITEFLILAYLLGPIVTSQLNGDVIIAGDRVLPGVGLYDAVSSVELAFILLIPFFLGRQYFRKATDSGAMLLALASAGLVYSIPLLFEIRFSPQLHYWLYGYYSSDFIQAIRGDGFRPMVFMGHGLLAAHFAMMAAVAAAILWRLREPIRGLAGGIATGYLAGVLLLCKSFGATIYGAGLIPVVRWSTPRMQARLAVALVCIAMLYPALRSLDLFPTDALVDAASAVNQDRADSLKMRFDNEDALLRHALERPLFGWGRFGRHRLYDEDTGKDITVTDGRWVITLGQFGWFGFIAEFGLLGMGVFRAFSALAVANTTSDRVLLSGMSLIVAVSVLDLLPNSGLVPWVWLMSGALLGRAEAILATAKQRSRVSRTFGAVQPSN
jgi:hypothetical protein